MSRGDDILSANGVRRATPGALEDAGALARPMRWADPAAD